MLKHETESTPENKIGRKEWNEGHVVDTGGMKFELASSAPAAPDAGSMMMYARSIGGRAMPAIVGPSGVTSALQPHIGRNRFLAWLPAGIAGTVNIIGGAAATSSATGRPIQQNSLFTSMRRVGYVTAASANANNNVRAHGPIWFLGAAPRLGGFHMMWRFGTATYAADGRVFIGLGANNSSYGPMSPSSMLNIIGIGYDPGDTSWSIYHNDGVGVPVKVPLGAGFPCNTESADVFDLSMFAAPGSASVLYTVTRLNDDTAVSGVLSADLPNVLLQPHLNVTNGASGAVVAVDLMSMYIETDY